MADIIEVNTRKFVRDFTRMKHLAASGASLRVVEGGLAFVFTLDRHKDGFLGCTKGTLKHQAGLKHLFSTGEKWDAAK
jgi:hypothetical protein